MFKVQSNRISMVVAVCALLVLLSDAWAGQDLKANAAEALEVRVLDAQMAPDSGQGERHDVLYRMEVISVVRSSSRIKPGDTIVVRSYASSKEAATKGLEAHKGPALLTPGWMGLAYLNPDPKASGSDAGSRYTIAANGDSFEDLPPAPPSIKYTR